MIRYNECAKKTTFANKAEQMGQRTCKLRRLSEDCCYREFYYLTTYEIIANGKTERKFHLMMTIIT